MMPRIFFHQKVTVGELVTIDGPDGHHFVRVLRANIGEQLVLAAENGPFLASISQIDTKLGTLAVAVKSKCQSHEPVHQLVVIQGLAKGDKMDTIIQKCTEIGATHIVCYEAKRSVVSLRGKVEQKLERWQRIALEAASQAQRDIVPSISYAVSVSVLRELLTRFGARYLLVLDEAEKTTGLNQALESIPDENDLTLALAVGPEGGWDDEERCALQELAGGISVTLGPRILRTETAPVAACAVVLYHFGQFGA